MTPAMNIGNKVFVGGIPVDISQEQLSDYMTQYGEVVFVKILQKANKSRGFGFVTFQSQEDASKVVAIDHFFRGKRFECKPVVNEKVAKKQAQEQKKQKVFLGGLHKSVNESQLIDYFKKFGEVHRAVVNRTHKSNLSRSSGFVQFKDPETAQRVIDIKEHCIEGFPVTCQPCLLREEIIESSLRSDPKGTDSKKASMQSSKRPSSDIEAKVNPHKRNFASIENIASASQYHPSSYKNHFSSLGKSFYQQGNSYRFGPKSYQENSNYEIYSQEIKTLSPEKNYEQQHGGQFYNNIPGPQYQYQMAMREYRDPSYCPPLNYPQYQQAQLPLPPARGPVPHYYPNQPNYYYQSPQYQQLPYQANQYGNPAHQMLQYQAFQQNQHQVMQPAPQHSYQHQRMQQYPPPK